MKILILFNFLFAISYVSAADDEKCQITLSTMLVCIDATEENLPNTVQENVKWLTFSKSTIQNVKASFLQNFPTLTHFHAENAGIENIDDNAFTSLKLLDWVDISSNKIKSVHVDLLKGTKVWHLNISGNTGLEIPRNEPFLDSATLRWLDLPKCDITDLYSESFSKLPGLKDLSLAFNKLKTLPEDIFLRNRLLRSLDITGNNIKFLSHKIFLSKGVMVLRFEDNPWECDCKMTPLLVLSKKNVLHGDVMCAKPKAKNWAEISNPLAWCSEISAPSTGVACDSFQLYHLITTFILFSLAT